MTGASKARRAVGWLLLALVALVNAGCLLAVAGAAGAGAAAGYIYYNGLLSRDYHASLADTLAAVRAVLWGMQFPVITEKIDAGSAYLQTRTGDGHPVRIYLTTVPSPIPAEGAVTRVGIRVGFAGDEGVSARLLDQVSRHLVPAAAVPPTEGPPAAGAAIGTPSPVRETPPPPLASPEPKR